VHQIPLTPGNYSIEASADGDYVRVFSQVDYGVGAALLEYAQVPGVTGLITLALPNM
jgi:hypothetical protein